MKKYLSRLLSVLLALTLLAAPASALTVEQALELLEDTYYYGVPEEAYEAESLDELFWLLGDPYTGYLSPELYQAFFESVEDTVDTVGIGVSVYLIDEGILVADVVPGGSAQEAGIQPGDCIVAIDGVSCVPAAEEHRQLMLGEEGTRVTVTVLRDGETRDYTLTRRAIYIPNTQVTLLEGGLGYVDCNSFGSDTGKLFADGLRKYDSQVNCWVVDLRGNGGGYVDSAADMLAALSGPGRYVYFEDKDGQVGAYARHDKAVSDKPLLLLVDGRSASASEAMASGLRDLGRAVIIGSRTYGKGVGQIILDETSYPEYFDGDGLKVTTGRFYSVGGTTTDLIGVIPTLLVDDWTTAAVAAALCGGSPDTSSLCVMPDGQPFYVNPDADEYTLSALLEALPPQITLFYRGGGAFDQVTPAQAADKLGLDYDNRWFNDVSDSLYANAINALGTYGLFGGTGGGCFDPEGQFTRAQLCVVLARLLNVTYNGPSRFSDVPQNSWYGPSVNAMAQLGLVTGSGGRFNPNSPITQEEFLTILGRTARHLNFALDAYGEIVDSSFDALPSDMQAGLAPYAKWARGGAAVLTWGLEDALDGYGDMLYTSLQNITPSAPVLREEAAAGIYAMLSGLEILP